MKTAMTKEMNGYGGLIEMTSKKAVTIVTAVLGLFLLGTVSSSIAQEAGQKTFASPQDAGKALFEAVQSNGTADDIAVLGASAASLVSSGDEVQDNNNR